MPNHMILFRSLQFTVEFKPSNVIEFRSNFQGILAVWMYACMLIYITIFKPFYPLGIKYLSFKFILQFMFLPKEMALSMMD